MKERMKSDKHVSQACTEIAIMDVLNSISGTHCHNYFQYCEVYMKKNHIWTADINESEEWSSQLIFQFKQLERRSLKKSGL